MKNKTIGVILAGGKGERFGGSLPKQFVKLAGKLVIEHTVEVFEKSKHIDEIIIVSRQDYTDFIWELAEKNQWLKLQKVVSGGLDRFDSTYSAIVAMADCSDTDKILFHDAVRPLVSDEILARCVNALDTFKAVDVVIPSSDTIVQIDDAGCITNIPARASLRRGQTPQAFQLGTIRAAYKNALAANKRSFTCDCGVVRAMLPGTEVITVDGAESNLKLTNPGDLFMAEKAIQTNSVDSVNSDADFTQISGKAVVIFGGSYGIGKAISDLCKMHGAQVFAFSRNDGGVDVRDANGVASALGSVYTQAGRIDAIVNTAGILIRKPLTSMSAQEINDILDVNLKGAVNVAFAAKNYLRDSRGCLLNFTSSSYTRGRAFYALYSATKCSVVNLTQALSEEWFSDGIRVNCINPERTRTPMRTLNFGEEPPESLLDPATVARAALTTITSSHTGLIIDVRNH
jgi:ribitol-5-phosphate 2-dehydrogenase (NADP+) / D-ribitol-5-phosphate cytidylyltransferase